MIANTPPAPYYAVIFSSIRSADERGYAEMAERMMELAAQQPGFLGVESAREQLGITVSYWASLDAIRRDSALSPAAATCGSNAREYGQKTHRVARFHWTCKNTRSSIYYAEVAQNTHNTVARRAESGLLV